MSAKEFIEQCQISGNTLIFPEIQLNRETYNEVKSLLEGINGKWNRKINGFVFEHPIQNDINRILDGEKINLNKQYQFFETPAEICKQLVELAGISANFNGTILEPSAGRGAIVKAIDAVANCQIDVCELMPQNIEVLHGLPFNINIVGKNYMDYSPSNKYDVIIANPPFTKNQDIVHLQKMYNDLNTGGVLVCITSTHWKISGNKKEKEFKTWLENKKHKVIELPAKTFEKTAVPTLIVKIEKKSTDNDFGFKIWEDGTVEKQVKSELYGETTAVGTIERIKECGYMPCGDGCDYRLTKAELKFIKTL